MFKGLIIYKQCHLKFRFFSTYTRVRNQKIYVKTEYAIEHFYVELE